MAALVLFLPKAIMAYTSMSMSLKEVPLYMRVEEPYLLK
jgi:hypothetical protein